MRAPNRTVAGVVWHRACRLWLAHERSDTAQLLDTLRKVDREGKGHRAATEAWAELTGRATADQLAHDSWRRSTAPVRWRPTGCGRRSTPWPSVSSNETGKLPVARLEKFLADQRARPAGPAAGLRVDRPRRSDGARHGWIPEDARRPEPGIAARRGGPGARAAAEKALADETERSGAGDLSQGAGAARDLDQVKVVTEALDKLGRPVDLPSHFGFLQDWQARRPVRQSRRARASTSPIRPRHGST